MLPMGPLILVMFLCAEPAAEARSTPQILRALSSSDGTAQLRSALEQERRNIAAAVATTFRHPPMTIQEQLARGNALELLGELGAVEAIPLLIREIEFTRLVAHGGPGRELALFPAVVALGKLGVAARQAVLNRLRRETSSRQLRLYAYARYTLPNLTGTLSSPSSNWSCCDIARNKTIVVRARPYTNGI